MSTRFELREGTPLRASPDQIAKELKRRLENSIQRRLAGSVAGCWLSGGLDSSAIAALARPYVDQLHTFAVGLRGAADLEFAQEAAAFLRATHHELVVDVDQLLAVLPTVIYSLESFDALLVRSSLTNYLVGELSSRFVPAVFSGEASDELFAGYEYLKSLPADELSGELSEITERLHNTAFQRVDRSASSYGIVAYVPFADGEVVEYAVRIPVAYKLCDGVEKWMSDAGRGGATFAAWEEPATGSRGERSSAGGSGPVETCAGGAWSGRRWPGPRWSRENGPRGIRVRQKWILRRAMYGLLPDRVRHRTKSKFWQGTGLGDLLARHAEEHVTDDAFERERVLANGWAIHSKEELLYYRAFREQFGELSELSWMGRTKGAPRARTKNASANQEAGT